MKEITRESYRKKQKEKGVWKRDKETNLETDIKRNMKIRIEWYIDRKREKYIGSERQSKKNP